MKKTAVVIGRQYPAAARVGFALGISVEEHRPGAKQEQELFKDLATFLGLERDTCGGEEVALEGLRVAKAPIAFLGFPRFLYAFLCISYVFYAFLCFSVCFLWLPISPVFFYVFLCFSMCFDVLLCFSVIFYAFICFVIWFSMLF